METVLQAVVREGKKIGAFLKWCVPVRLGIGGGRRRLIGLSKIL